MADVIYVNNDNVVWLSGLRNNVTGEYLTAGIVGLTGLYDSAGALVTGQAWPAAMSYVANPPGDIGLPDLHGCWMVVIDEEAAILDGREYIAQIDAEAEGDLKGRWWLRLLARIRRE